MPRISIKDVLEKHSTKMMEIPGVVGVAVGEAQGKPCVRVFVTNKKSGVLEQIPATLEGYPVILEESGEFRALGSR